MKFEIIERLPSLGARIWEIKCLSCGVKFNYDSNEPHNYGLVVCTGKCHSTERWKAAKARYDKEKE